MEEAVPTAILLVALAASPPAANIERVCRSALTTALQEDSAAAYRSCIRDEHLALEELRRRWTSYSAEARAVCAEPAGGEVSYIELETCLEMQPGGSLSVQSPPTHAGRH